MKKLLFGLLITAAVSTQAANLASDSAASSAYNDGWQTGDNGGLGFGAWTLTLTSSNPDRNGHFIGNSANNGDPAPTGNINTEGVSWGMYANYSTGPSGEEVGLATATRAFTGGELSINQTLRLKMDSGLVNSWGGGNGSVGFSLNRFSLFFASNSSEYRIGYGDFNDTGGLQGTGVPLTYDGLDVAFTRTGLNTYTLVLTPGGGSATVINGTMSETGGSLNSITLYNRTAGSGSSRDVFFNSMEIVPEPSTIALGLTGLAALLAFRRKKLS